MKSEVRTIEQSNEECRSEEELILISDFDCSNVRLFN